VSPFQTTAICLFWSYSFLKRAPKCLYFKLQQLVYLHISRSSKYLHFKLQQFVYSDHTHSWNVLQSVFISNWNSLSIQILLIHETCSKLSSFKTVAICQFRLNSLLKCSPHCLDLKPQQFENLSVSNSQNVLHVVFISNYIHFFTASI
jgi:hypothetical protein